MSGFLLGAINLYQHFLSPLLPRSCRFQPSCSHYAHTAIARFGALNGIVLAARRVLRCHPFNSGGYDPVPESRTDSAPAGQGLAS